MKQIQPIGDRVLAVQIKAKTTSQGGILIPETSREKPMECEIMALGTGKQNKDGKKLTFDVKVGDRVLVSKYGGTEIQIENVDYRLLQSDDILAVIK